MGAIRRTIYLVFVFSALISTGFLSYLFFDPWSNARLVLQYLVQHQWIPYVLLGLLIIELLGILVVLGVALFTPHKSSQITDDTGQGKIQISRMALESNARKSAGSFQGITCDDAEVRIINKRKPFMRVYVDATSHGVTDLARAGLLVQEAVKSNLENFTGYEVKEVQVRFYQAEDRLSVH